MLSSRGLKALQSRGYADEMQFTLAAANKVFYDNANVRQVDVPSFSGAFGILPKHVPTLGKFIILFNTLFILYVEIVLF